MIMNIAQLYDVMVYVVEATVLHGKNALFAQDVWIVNLLLKLPNVG